MSGVVTVSIRVGGSWYTPTTADEEWVTSSNGGPVSARLRIVDGVLRERLRPDSLVVISSTRTGKVLWSGTVGPDGVTRDGMDYEVQCAGAAQLMYERARRLPYLVRRSSAWEQDPVEKSSANGEIAEASENNGMITARFARGPHNPGDRARVRYVGHQDTELTIGGVSFYVASGWDNIYSNSPWRNVLYIGATGWDNRPIDTWPQRASRRMEAKAAQWGEAGTEFPAGQREASLEWRFEGTVGDGAGFTSEEDKYWTNWYSISVASQLTDRSGRDAPVTVDTISPAAVVEDMIARSPNLLSPDRTRSPGALDIAPNEWRLDVLDYDLASFGQVLDDLVSMQDDWLWMLTPIDTSDLRHGLVLRRWNSRVMYYTDFAYTLPTGIDVQWSREGDDALYNRVTVRWKDGSGQQRQVVRTATVAGGFPDLAELEAMGRIRDLPVIDLGEETASAANAARVATVMLQQVARRPRGGTVTVTQPLHDIRSGSMVPPEELTPGVLVQVQETGEILRLVQVTAQANGTAVLDLSSRRRDVAQVLAGVKREAKWRTG